MSKSAAVSTATVHIPEVGSIIVHEEQGQVCVRTYLAHETSVVYLDVVEATALIAALTDAVHEAVA